MVGRVAWGGCGNAEEGKFDGNRGFEKGDGWCMDYCVAG